MNKYLEYYNIREDVYKKVLKIEEELKCEFEHIDKQEELNSLKVLSSFKKVGISEASFNSTTGYGYNDLGRSQIEKVFSSVLGSEDALVRRDFISGSHALTVCLFGLLRPNDLMLSITGLPYDTLHEVIGIKENASSLISFGIKYDQIDLVNDDFDYAKIKEYLKNNKVKLIEIQRSRGYSERKSIMIEKLEKVCKLIKEVSPETIIMVDNCYCEFVEDKTPTEVGADIMVGSLIKNLGGGIAPNGGYIAGKESLVNLCAERLTVPGEGREVGPTLGINKEFLMGLYHAPYVVASSLKISLLTAKLLEDLGYSVNPKYNEEHADIVLSITFGNKDDLIKYAEGIQSASAIDADSVPIPSPMPGYDNEIIMASGSFTQGSSIEISCDGPLVEPYILYEQGSLTYSYGKIAIMSAVSKLLNNKEKN